MDANQYISAYLKLPEHLVSRFVGNHVSGKGNKILNYYTKKRRLCSILIKSATQIFYAMYESEDEKIFKRYIKYLIKAGTLKVIRVD